MDAHSSNGALVEEFSAALQEAESSLRRMGQLSFFTDDLFSELESHLASQEVSLMMPLISPEFAREATIKAMIDLARAADGSLPWDGWLDQARAVKNSLCEIALFYASRAAT
jgi:hypothetical protein